MMSLWEWRGIASPVRVFLSPTEFVQCANVVERNKRTRREADKEGDRLLIAKNGEKGIFSETSRGRG